MVSELPLPRTLSADEWKCLFQGHRLDIIPASWMAGAVYRTLFKTHMICAREKHGQHYLYVTDGACTLVSPLGGVTCERLFGCLQSEGESLSTRLPPSPRLLQFSIDSMFSSAWRAVPQAVLRVAPSLESTPTPAWSLPHSGVKPWFRQIPSCPSSLSTWPLPGHNRAAPFVDNPTETLSPDLLQAWSSEKPARRRSLPPSWHLSKGLLSDSTLTTHLLTGVALKGAYYFTVFARLQFSSWSSDLCWRLLILFEVETKSWWCCWCCQQIP